jgi:UTP--glucose-1-phosphate uridylyltransferase
MTVDIAVIPAAGRGTRMRPATRVVPKALLTVVDRPTIQYAVEEAARAGAKEAILIVDLEVGHLVHQHFVNSGPLPGLEHVKIRPVVQEEPLGLGHAVLEAERMVAHRPFMCILADDIVRPGLDVVPDLIEAASDGSSVVCIQEMTPEVIVSKGAVIPTSELVDGVMSIGGAIEKPDESSIPSLYGVLGRYVFQPEIFEHLATLEPGRGGEIQLTDAMNRLGMEGRLKGVVTDQEFLDVGNPLGLLRASMVLGSHQFSEFSDIASQELGLG